MTDSKSRFRWHEANASPAAELLRECGQKLTDPALWSMFHDRFQGPIFVYLLRSLRLRSVHDGGADVVPDLAQEVYVRLVQNNGRMLRSFRGTSDFSAMAFLARVSATVAFDFQRRIASNKRAGQVISMDQLKHEKTGSGESAEFDAGALSSILSWIDVERVVEGDPDRRNAQRNALIFKLHYVDGFSPKEIARFPGFELSKSGVETILARLKQRIQR
jgi:DNA-directed RNA polymerase specialized sigma24 family protein